MRKSPWFNALLFPVSVDLLFLFMHNRLITCMEKQRNQGLGEMDSQAITSTLIFQFLAQRDFPETGDYGWFLELVYAEGWK